jgi:hypothetical protein
VPFRPHEHLLVVASHTRKPGPASHGSVEAEVFCFSRNWKNGPPFQYDRSQRCRLVFLNNVKVGPHVNVTRPTSVLEVAHVERLPGQNVDAGARNLCSRRSWPKCFYSVEGETAKNVSRLARRRYV